MSFQHHARDDSCGAKAFGFQQLPRGGKLVVEDTCLDYAGCFRERRIKSSFG